MQLEVGKYYRLRNGDIAKIEAIFKPEKFLALPELPVIGRSVYFDRLSWNMHGRYSQKQLSGLDIVAPFTGVLDKELQKLAIQKRRGVKLCMRTSLL